MIAVVTAVGAFIAGVIPVLVSIRWSRSARLRRALDADAAILEKLPDGDAAHQSMLRVLRRNAAELDDLDRDSLGVHPMTTLGLIMFVAGITIAFISGEPFQAIAGTPDASDTTRRVFEAIGWGMYAVGVVLVMWRAVSRPFPGEKRYRRRSQIVADEGAATPSPAPTTAPPPDGS